MASFADQLTRLRVAVVTGRLPADLGRWALDQLTSRARHRELLAVRDGLLREAAAMLEGDSMIARARALSAELVAMHRRQGQLTGAREILADVLELDPGCPTSPRQLARILDTEPPFGDQGCRGRNRTR